MDIHAVPAVQVGEPTAEVVAEQVDERSVHRLELTCTWSPCRSLTLPNRELGRRSDPSVYAGIAVVLVLQTLFVFAPFMHSIFGAAALGVRELASTAAAAVIILSITWVEERRRVTRAHPLAPGGSRRWGVER